MIRVTWFLVAALSFLAAACADSSDNYTDKLTNIDPEWAVTADEGYEWALVKDANLPAMTGSPEWNNYIAFLEEKLLEYGAVDVFRKGRVKGNRELPLLSCELEAREGSVVGIGIADTVDSPGSPAGTRGGAPIQRGASEGEGCSAF